MMLYISRSKLPRPIGEPRNVYFRIPLKVSISRLIDALVLVLAYIHVKKMIPIELSSWATLNYVVKV
jgi:hypothetical protein